MTQGSMFPEFRVYAIDANCVIGLNNRHVLLDGQTLNPEFTEAERAAIWQGLESLAADGRLKVIPAVRGEIKRHDPDGYARLMGLNRTTVRVNNRIRRNYQMLIEQHPDWAPKGFERYDKGDPWLIAYAIDRGWDVLSNEKRRSEQRKPRRNKPKIPDVCDVHSIRCHKLREFAQVQGWIP